MAEIITTDQTVPAPNRVKQQNRHIIPVIALIVAGLVGWRVLFPWVQQRLFNPPTPAQFVQASHGLNYTKLSADGRLLLGYSTGENGKATVWEAGTGKQLWQWQGDGRIELSHDSKRLLTIIDDREGQQSGYSLLDTSTWHTIYRWSGNGRIYQPSPNLSLILVTRRPRNVELWETATGKLRGSYTRKTKTGYQMRFSEDEHHLVAWDLQKTGYVYETDGFRPLFQIPNLFETSFSHDGKRLLGLGYNGTLHIWDIASHRHTSMHTSLIRGDWIYDLDDGRIVIGGTKYTGPVGQENSRAGRESSNLSSLIEIRSMDGVRLLKSLPYDRTSISPDGKTLSVTKNEWDTKIGKTLTKYHIVDVPTGRLITVLDTSHDVLGNAIETDGFGKYLLRPLLAPDQRHFFIASSDGLIRLYDTEHPRRLSNPTRPPDKYHPFGGPMVYSAGPAEVTLPDGHAIEMRKDFDTTGIIPSQQHVDNRSFQVVRAVASPDKGKVLVFWQRLPDKNDSVSVQYDPKLGEQTNWIELRDTRHGQVLRKIKLSGGQGTLGWPAWSLDSRYVALCTETGSIFVWEAATGVQCGQMSDAVIYNHITQEFVSTTSFVPALAFSADGRYLAVGRDDGSIYLYSLTTRLPVAQIGKVNDPLSWLHASSDGRKIYGIGPFNKVSTFDMPANL